MGLGSRDTMEQVPVKKEACMGMTRRTVSVSMKLLIDTKGKRVLFAEAGKDCVDFLFQILSLPVATVISLLGEEGIGGSWPNLYKSIKNLDYTYVVCDKDTLLKPAARVSSCRVPLLPLRGKIAPMDTMGNNFYKCGRKSCSSIGFFSDDCTTICPCSRPMTTKLNLMYVASPAVQSELRGAHGVVHGMATYMVMDDLEVKPMSKISTLTLLNDFHLNSLDDLKEKVVNLGMNEALKLLKASHQSKTVLTDVYC